MSWLGVFFVCAAMDFAWARYIHHTSRSHAGSAAAWSVAVMLLSALSIIAYTENHLLLVPAAGGYYVGTYLATSPRVRAWWRHWLGDDREVPPQTGHP